MLLYPPMTSDNVAQARYDATVKALEFELDQFWKRSIFFWGFIAVAFGAFAAAADKHPALLSPIASFGFVCSAIWTLANRGSKFWYESWEEERKVAQVPITGTLYGETKVKSDEDEPWLRARPFSPSKLTIALSDYTVVFWLCLLFSRVPAIKRELANCPCVIPITFIVFSIFYVLLVACSSFSPKKATTKP